MRRLLLLALIICFIVPFIAIAQDAVPTEDDLVVPLVPTEDDLAVPLVPTEDDLVVPLVPTVDDLVVPLVPTEDDLVVPLVPTVDDLVVPLVTATPQTFPWDVPVAGIYAREFVDTSLGGNCDDFSGDNGGMAPGYYDPEDPNQQAYVCTWPSRGIVLVDNETYYWRGGQYTTDTYIDSFDNSSSSRRLNIIGPTELEVVLETEAGECSVTQVIRYTLVRAGSAFACTTSLPQESQEEPISTPSPDQPIPETEETDTIIDPPLVVEGQYVVGWRPVDSYCDVTYQPIFENVTLVKASEDSISLYVDGEVYNLDGERLRGEYTIYTDQLMITLTRRFADDFIITWQASSEDNSESCYAQGFVTLGQELSADERAALNPPPPSLPADPGPIDINAENGTGDSGSGEAQPFEPIGDISGSYTATWEPLEDLCTSTDLLPNFETATLTQTESGGFTLDYDGGSYLLENYGGVVFYTGAADGFTESITINSAESGYIDANFSSFGDDGVSLCMATLILTGN